MLMPETAPNLHNSSVLRKDEVGRSGKCSVMQTKSQSRAMEVFPDDQLGVCIFATDAGHHPASSFSVYNVSHLQRLVVMPVETRSRYRLDKVGSGVPLLELLAQPPNCQTACMPEYPKQVFRIAS